MATGNAFVDWHPTDEEEEEEEEKKKQGAKEKRPKRKIRPSPWDQGFTFGQNAKTTTQESMVKVQVSRNNKILMDAMHLVDESSQRLQRMLKGPTASVPGQQIPDEARTARRMKKEKELRDRTLEAALVDVERREDREGQSELEDTTATDAQASKEQ